MYLVLKFDFWDFATKNQLWKIFGKAKRNSLLKNKQNVNEKEMKFSLKKKHYFCFIKN